MSDQHRDQVPFHRRELLKAAATTASGLLVASALRSEDAQSETTGSIEAYPERLSYAPGEDVRLHVSSTESEYSIEVARVGAERGVVFERSGLRGSFHATPPNASTHGCGWPVSTSFKVGADWRSGYYTNNELSHIHI